MQIKPFKYTTKVRFDDTDKYGHVNNSRYFTLFEEARTEWVYSFEKLINWGEINHIQFVIVEQNCKYNIPLLHPNEIEITQEIIKFGAASIEFNYELRLANQQEILTTASTKLAFYNAKTNKLERIPNHIKQSILQNND